MYFHCVRNHLGKCLNLWESALCYEIFVQVSEGFLSKLIRNFMLFNNCLHAGSVYSKSIGVAYVTGYKYVDILCVFLGCRRSRSPRVVSEARIVAV